MAKAPSKAPVKPAAKKSSGEPKMIKGIYVRSFPATFRRAGFEFTSEGHGIALDLVSKEQLMAIENEPMLHVEHCEFPADAESDAALAAEAGDAKQPANDATGAGDSTGPAQAGTRENDGQQTQPADAAGNA